MLMLAAGLLGAVLAGSMVDFASLLDDDDLDDSFDEFDADDPAVAAAMVPADEFLTMHAGGMPQDVVANAPETDGADAEDVVVPFLPAGDAPDDIPQGGNGGDWLDGDDEDDAVLRDYLNHGAADDRLALADDDMGTGDAGADNFHLAPNPGGPAPLVPDYDPAEDRLVLNYDTRFGAPPSIAVAPDPTDPANAIVFADGLAVGLVQGGAGITASMIALQPLPVAA